MILQLLVGWSMYELLNFSYHHTSLKGLKWSILRFRKFKSKRRFNCQLIKIQLCKGKMSSLMRIGSRASIWITGSSLQLSQRAPSSLLKGSYIPSRPSGNQKSSLMTHTVQLKVLINVLLKCSRKDELITNT